MTEPIRKNDRLDQPESAEVDAAAPLNVGPSSSSVPIGDDSVAQLAGAYAEALNQGQEAEGAIAARLDRAAPGLVECLQRLKRQWPTRPHDEAVDPDRPRSQDGPNEEAEVNGAATSTASIPPDASLQLDTGISVAGSAYPSIGRFSIERELGRGGFGVVFLARDRALQRQVALKVPRLETLLSPEGRERFLREARVTASLDHPHIVPVHEAGEDGAVCYIATAYCAGPNLAQWLAEQDDPCQPRVAAKIILRLAEAVEHAHRRGVLHRDLKPSNIMLDTAAEGSDDELPFVPRLTDFGLAGLFEPTQADTRSGVVLGTPVYMAPEQLHPNGVRRPETDVYGLGAIFYELLTGGPPHESESVIEVFDAIRRDDLSPPTRCNPRVPRDLAAVCLKCLRKEPGDRYHTAGELARELRRYLAGESIEARPIARRVLFARWARRPERLREAGIVTIAINLSVLVWLVVDTPIALGLIPRLFSGAAAATRDQFMVVANHLFGIVAGIGMLRTQRWALWASAGLGVLNLAAAVLVLTGVVEPFAGLYQDPVLRVLLFTILGSMFVVWTGFCMMILLARAFAPRDG